MMKLIKLTLLILAFLGFESHFVFATGTKETQQGGGGAAKKELLPKIEGRYLTDKEIDDLLIQIEKITGTSAADQEKKNKLQMQIVRSGWNGQGKAIEEFYYNETVRSRAHYAQISDLELSLINKAYHQSSKPGQGMKQWIVSKEGRLALAQEIKDNAERICKELDINPYGRMIHLSSIAGVYQRIASGSLTSLEKIITIESFNLAFHPMTMLIMLTAEERKNRKLVIPPREKIKENILYFYAGEGLEPQPLHKSFRTQIFESIFVVSMDQKVYSNVAARTRFHHSSFLRGAPVLSAGEFILDKNGIVKEITNESGHYKPGKKEVYNGLMILSQYLDLSTIRFKFRNAKGKIVIYPNAQKFLELLKLIKEGDQGKLNAAASKIQKIARGNLAKRKVQKIRKLKEESRELDLYLQRQRAVMFQLYNLTETIKPDLDLPPRNWVGVQVDYKGRITSITLKNKYLKGKIPEELSSLTELKKVDLVSNYLTNSKEFKELMKQRLPNCRVLVQGQRK